jgi:hypothetical protein
MKHKRSIVAAAATLSLIGAAPVAAVTLINSGSATADGNDYSGDQCSSGGDFCEYNSNRGTYLTNGNAGAGQVEWTTYNYVCVISAGIVDHATLKEGWGPFSTNVESTPLTHQEYNNGLGC